MTTISATKARANLYDLIEKVSKTGRSVGITKQGKTKAILMSLEEVESWQETVDVLSNTRLMRDIRQAMRDVKTGRVYPLNQIVKELEIDES